MITFTQPVYLVLLILLPLSALIALPRLRRQRGKGGARPVSTHAWAGLFIRSLLLLSVIFALAGLESVTYNNKLAVAFLVDVSDSLRASGRDQELQWVREALNSMRSDGSDEAAVILFGADAQIERSLSSLKDLPAFSTQVRTAGTDIESAIRLGLAILPNDHAKRLVLLSDGQQTVGNADSAARLARAVNARFDVVPIQVQQGPDAAVVRIDAPQQASMGQVIPLQIAVRSNTAMRAQLTVLAGPDVVAQQNVNLVVGQNEFNVRANATRVGFIPFRVQISAETDTVPQNDTLAASAIVGGPPRVLLVAVPPGIALPGNVGVSVDETTALKAALTATGILFDESTPGALPTEMQSLSTYQAVILVDVPARELTPRGMSALQSYVRDAGGGLVTVGGPTSYGVGGYFKTPLEETLPVDTQIKDPRRFPSISMVIVMDKSGSMSVQEGGVMKIQLAAEAAARASELLNDDDEITIIPFDTAPGTIGPFLGSDRAKHLPEVLSIGPGGGGIYVYDSLAEADRIISKSDRLTKLVVLMADGNDAEKQDGARELVAQMHAKDITVSVVSVGDGSDVNFLKDVARIGGGRFHLTTRASNLPTIFTEETALAQRSYIVEQDFFPMQGSSSPILSGITSVPQLLGYVATTAKPAAQVVLKANDTDPLLATWQYGLGRAASFTSDATGRWAKAWVGWQDFPKFWAQTVRWTIVERTDTGVEAKVTQQGDQSLIQADLPPARFDDNLKLNALLIDSSGKQDQIPLVQTAPGHYEAPAYLDQAGAYFTRIDSASAVTGTATVTEATRVERAFTWVKPYSAEYAPATSSSDQMDAWAALGGGERLTSPARTFDLNAPVAASRTELFPWLLALAALLLPFDIGIRRIAISFRKLLGLGRRELAMVTLERGGRMSQLLQAKSRSTQLQEPVSLFDSGALGRARAAARLRPLPQAQQQMAGQPEPAEAESEEPEAPTQAAATAAELLRRRRKADAPAEPPIEA